MRTPSIWRRLARAVAWLAIFLSAGVVTWVGVAVLIGPDASDIVWTWLERGSWLAALAGLYVSRRPRAREATHAPESSAPGRAGAGVATVVGRAAKDPTESREVVRKLWTDVADLLVRDNERRIADGEPARSWKQVARAASVPSRNVNLWLKRKRHLPDEKNFLNLIAAIGGTPEEWEPRWRHADAARRGLMAPDIDPASPVRPDSEGEQAAAPDRRSLFGTAALTGLLVGMLVAVTPSTPLAVRELDGPETWPATVINTYRTDPGGGNPVDVGVNSYRGPYHSADDRMAVRSYFNGDRVNVVCVVKNGRLIKDSSDPAKSSNHWYQLEDNSYLPAGFVETSSEVPPCPGN